MTKRPPLLGTLPDGPTPERWMLLCAAEPPDDGCFRSEQVQVFHNWTEEPWQDARPHHHTDSDEVYVVLEGAMRIAVDGTPVDVPAGGYLCIPAGTVHQLLDVVTPHRSFVIRGPSVRDKVEA